MKIILRKIHARTPFAFFEPVRVEPLELEYLEAALEGIPAAVVVEDARFTKKSRGDIYVLTGYNTAYDEMRKEARTIRKAQPKAVLIVGGVDAQVNTADYEVDEFDYVFFSGALEAFRAFMDRLLQGNVEIMPGLSIRRAQGWVRGPRQAMKAPNGIQPNRALFQRIKDRTRYLNYRKVALVQRRIGCPHGCGFCFCRLLNGGHAVARSFEALFAEMDGIDASYYWVVDDVFLTGEAELSAFLEVAQRRETPYALIVYLRAEFLLQYRKRVPELKAAGVTEVIVGFESIQSKVLHAYGKGVSGSENEEVAHILAQNELSYTALFMVSPEDDLNDFVALRRFIAGKRMPSAAFSILTPLKGTALYDAYAPFLLEKRSRRYDFLHLVLPPTTLSPLRFRWEFLRLHLALVKHAPQVRTYILKGRWIR